MFVPHTFPSKSADSTFGRSAAAELARCKSAEPSRAESERRAPCSPAITRNARLPSRGASGAGIWKGAEEVGYAAGGGEEVGVRG